MKKQPYPSQSQDRFIIRFPEGMRDWIAEQAKKNGRSMNSEIIARLEATVSADKKFSDIGPSRETIEEIVKATASQVALEQLDAIMKLINDINGRKDVE